MYKAREGRFSRPDRSSTGFLFLENTGRNVPPGVLVRRPVCHEKPRASRRTA
ncbi:MAG: hypothetical protein ACK55I_01205 [bacterium]